jgi:hypothetical protein
MSASRCSSQLMAPSIHELYDDFDYTQHTEFLSDVIECDRREPVSQSDIQLLIDFYDGKTSTCPIHFEGSYQALDCYSTNIEDVEVYPIILNFYFGKDFKNGLEYLQVTPHHIYQYDIWSWQIIPGYCKVLTAKKTIQSHGHDLTTKFTLSIPI